LGTKRHVSLPKGGCHVSGTSKKRRAREKELLQRRGVIVRGFGEDISRGKKKGKGGTPQIQSRAEYLSHHRSKLEGIPKGPTDSGSERRKKKENPEITGKLMYTNKTKGGRGKGGEGVMQEQET